LTDAEWAVIAPLRPARKTTGRPRTTGIRDVVDAILCIDTTGCQ
jgi:transposase